VFQGGDGIRAFHVTGVQTCALPISPPPRCAFQARCSFRTRDAFRVYLVVGPGIPVAVDATESPRVVVVGAPTSVSVTTGWVGSRSEARRVGKGRDPAAALSLYACVQ